MPQSWAKYAWVIHSKLTCIHREKSLLVCQPLAQRACSSRTVNLLLRRPNPLMQVNVQQQLFELTTAMATFSLCSNVESTTRAWQRTDLIHLSLCSRLSGLLSRPLEIHGASCHSFKNTSLWRPLFVHMVLQFWLIVGCSRAHLLCSPGKDTDYIRNDYLKNIFHCV